MAGSGWRPSARQATTWSNSRTDRFARDRDSSDCDIRPASCKGTFSRKPVEIGLGRDAVEKREGRVPSLCDHPVRPPLGGQVVGEGDQRVGAVRAMRGVDGGADTGIVDIEQSLSRMSTPRRRSRRSRMRMNDRRDWWNDPMRARRITCAGGRSGTCAAGCGWRSVMRRGSKAGLEEPVPVVAHDPGDLGGIEARRRAGRSRCCRSRGCRGTSRASAGNPGAAAEPSP